jgi:2-hydroxychromene-2-carboxylate isomerase
MTAAALDFYFDIVCPYAWMGAEAVADLQARTSAAVRWRPILLGGVFQAVGQDPVPASQWAPARAVLGHKDVLRQAAVRGLPLRWPSQHPRRTVDAMRLLVAAPADRVPALGLALYRAYWTEDRDVADLDVLRAVAASVGVDPGLVGDPAARDTLRAATAEAVDAGVFGVPAWRVGERLWWGSDRLHFVEEALTGPAVDPAPPPGGEGAAFDFFHDFASPFSYLASTQVQAVAARHGATVRLRPILLGALFREIGTPNVPMLAMNPAKQQWVARDLGNWAQHWGVPLRWPSCFPVRTVVPLRAALVEPAATAPLYHALWAQDRNIGEPEVCRAVLDEAGLDGAAILARTQEPAIKQQLKDNTSAARDAGACGVPTYRLDDGMLIWGQDRLDLLGRCLAGWRPPAEAL